MRGGLRKQAVLLLAVVVAVLAVLPFARAVRHQFLAYDDDKFVTENPAVRAGLTAAGIGWAFTTFHAANWQPLAWVSHLVDVEIHGLDPAGHHGTNLAIHGSNAALLFLLLLRLTGAAGRSFAAAALFAVHPLRAETVMWVAQRNNLLGMFFGLLCLQAYARYAARPSPGRYVAVTLWFVCGLLSKPVVVMLPAVLLVLDFWPLDRGRRPRTAPLLEKLPLAALACASAAVTFLAQRQGHAVAGLDAVPAALRTQNALVATVRHLLHLGWPVDLVALYPLNAGDVSPTKAALALLLLVVVSCGAACLRKRWPFFLAGWLWFLAMLVPVIGIVQVGSQSMADRYTYWAAIGPGVAVVWLAGAAATALGVRRVVSAAVAGGVLALLGLQAAALAATWESDLSLFARATALTGGNSIAELNYGAALARAGRTEEAIEHYRRSIALNYRQADAHYNLGVNLDRLGRAGAARAAYQEALRCDPRHAAALNNLGLSYVREGRVEAAVPYFQGALREEPDNPRNRMNLGLALESLRRNEAAAEQFRAVVRLQPGNDAARSALRRLGVPPAPP